MDDDPFVFPYDPKVAPIHLDENVVQLIEFLNELPCIRTGESSCGGHRDPLPYDPEDVGPYAAQLPEGEFYVSFEVEMTLEGWNSLACITAAQIRPHPVTGVLPFPDIDVRVGYREGLEDRPPR